MLNILCLAVSWRYVNISKHQSPKHCAKENLNVILSGEKKYQNYLNWSSKTVTYTSKNKNKYCWVWMTGTLKLKVKKPVLLAGFLKVCLYRYKQLTRFLDGRVVHTFMRFILARVKGARFYLVFSFPFWRSFPAQWSTWTCNLDP